MRADRSCLPRRPLRRDGSAVAAVEFGLLAPIWALLLMMSIDFGEAFYLQMQLASTLNGAAQYAFLNAQTVTPTTVAAFLSNTQTVTQTAASPGVAPVVTVLFNNAASAANSGNYYCVSGSSPVVYTSTGTSSASCGGSVTSGKFVTISMTGSMSTFFSADPIFGATITMSDSAVVRFQ